MRPKKKLKEKPEEIMMLEQIIEGLKKAGIRPESRKYALIYAFLKTERLVTEENIKKLSPEEVAEWKQAVPEQMKGTRLYLVTLNGECPVGKAQEIKEAGMIAYVPDELQKKKHLKNKSWIRALSTLPIDLGGVLPKKVK